MGKSAKKNCESDTHEKSTDVEKFKYQPDNMIRERVDKQQIEYVKRAFTPEQLVEDRIKEKPDQSSKEDNVESN